MAGGYYGDEAGSSVRSAAWEELKGGASIAANTLSFGLSDYSGATASWQYQGIDYQWSRAFAHTPPKIVFRVGDCGP